VQGAPEEARAEQEAGLVGPRWLPEKEFHLLANGRLGVR
jgi:hypothetical protein